MCENFQSVFKSRVDDSSGNTSKTTKLDYQQPAAALPSAYCVCIKTGSGGNSDSTANIGFISCFKVEVLMLSYR